MGREETQAAMDEMVDALNGVLESSLNPAIKLLENAFEEVFAVSSRIQNMRPPDREPTTKPPRHEPGEVEPEPEPEPDPEPVLGTEWIGSSVKHGGITWTFDGPHIIGRFFDGSPYVRGPFVVQSITPGFDGRANGSELNPIPSSRTGLDMRTLTATHAAWGIPDLSRVAHVPIRMAEGDSLLSAISHDYAVPKGPQLKEAQVLTCIGLLASVGLMDFRPPYCAAEGRLGGWSYTGVYESEASNLPRMPIVPGCPAPDDPALLAKFSKGPWIFTCNNEGGNATHPSETMPDDYGPNLCSEIGSAYLSLCSDFEPERKLELLRHIVQIGIDARGVIQAAPDHWYSAPHHVGMKWAAMFAESVLGLEPIAADWFGVEDQMTFTVNAARPQQGIGPELVGKPEWCINYAGPKGRPELADGRWQFSDPIKPGQVVKVANSVKYRHVVAPAWWAQAACAEAMALRVAWGWEPFFLYMDRFERENTKRGILDWRHSWFSWHYDAWKAWRQA